MNNKIDFHECLIFLYLLLMAAFTLCYMLSLILRSYTLFIISIFSIIVCVVLFGVEMYIDEYLTKKNIEGK
jgi:hypothetical protein